MGDLERASAKRARRGQLQRTALAVLLTAGVIGVALAAPNTLQLLGKADPAWITGESPEKKLRSVASRLRKKGYVEFVKDGGRLRMRITPRGRLFLHGTVLHGQRLPRKKKWDGQWRLVIFDIPERRRALRDKVRNLVQGFGFIRLQDSIWAFPHDCEDVITLLKAELHIGRELLYIIASSIEFDAPLRERFNLD